MVLEYYLQSRNHRKPVIQIKYQFESIHCNALLSLRLLLRRDNLIRFDKPIPNLKQLLRYKLERVKGL